MSALLEVAGLTRVFGGLRAVSDLSFSVQAGEIVGLIGPNGAGKTTAFHLISGTLRPTRGEVAFKGASIVGLRPNRIARLGLVRTFQSTMTYPKATVWENAMRGAFVRTPVSFVDALLDTRRARRSQQAAGTAVDELLDLLSLAPYRDQPAGDLPYGFQRRLGVAVALAAQPDLLLLDEPVAGLNPEESAEIGRLIQLIAARRAVTILLVEHHMRLVMGLCDRIIVLDHGEKIAEGTPKQIRADEKVIAAYLGPQDGAADA